MTMSDVTVVTASSIVTIALPQCTIATLPNSCHIQMFVSQQTSLRLGLWCVPGDLRSAYTTYFNPRTFAEVRQGVIFPVRGRIGSYTVPIIH